MFCIRLLLDLLAQGFVQAAGSGNEQAGLWPLFSHEFHGLNLQSQIVFWLQQANGDQQRLMIAKKLFYCGRKFSLCSDSGRRRVWRNQPYAIRLHPEPFEKSSNLGVHRDDAVETPQCKRPQSSRMRRAAFIRRWISAGMKSQNAVGFRKARTRNCETKLANKNAPADMQMNDVVTMGQQMCQNFHGIGGIKDSIRRWSAKSIEIHHIASDATLS